MAVHRATKADRDAILGMLKIFHSVVRYEWPFDPARIGRSVDLLIDHTDAIILVSTNSEGKRVGILGATNEESLLAPLKISFERFFWVNIGERGSVHQELLTAWNTWAKAEECTDLVLTSLVDQREKAIGRLYRMYGFDLVELMYRKTI